MEYGVSPDFTAPTTRDANRTAPREARMSEDACGTGRAYGLRVSSSSSSNEEGAREAGAKGEAPGTPAGRAALGATTAPVLAFWLAACDATPRRDQAAPTGRTRNHHMPPPQTPAAAPGG